MSQLLTVHEVCAKLKVQKTTVYKWLKEDPSFPRQITLGPRVVRWQEEALDTWVQQQAHG